MYKINIGKELTKYFDRYHQATSYCKSVGFSTRKIKKVN